MPSLCGLFLLISLIYDCLYSISLKILFYFLKLFISIYNCLYSLFSLSQAYVHLSNTATHLKVFFIWICLYCVSVILFWQGLLLKMATWLQWPWMMAPPFYAFQYGGGTITTTSGTTKEELHSLLLLWEGACSTQTLFIWVIAKSTMQRPAHPENISAYDSGNPPWSACKLLANLILLPAQVGSVETWAWSQLLFFWPWVSTKASRPEEGGRNQAQTFQTTLACQFVVGGC